MKKLTVKLGLVPEKQIFWCGEVVKCDLCKAAFDTVMYDSNTRYGWGNVCQPCFKEHGRGLGIGLGQRYEKQPDGRWLLTGGRSA